MPKQVDLLVIEALQVTAAQFARQLGKSVVLAERMLWGYLSKSRLYSNKGAVESAHLYDNPAAWRNMGRGVILSTDLSQVVSRKRSGMSLVQGLAYLLKQKGVEVLPSEASFCPRPSEDRG